MSDINSTIYIDKDPPMDMNDEEKIIDYLAYMKERFNFVLYNINKRLLEIEDSIGG